MAVTFSTRQQPPEQRMPPGRIPATGAPAGSAPAQAGAPQIGPAAVPALYRNPQPAQPQSPAGISPAPAGQQGQSLQDLAQEFQADVQRKQKLDMLIAMAKKRLAEVQRAQGKTPEQAANPYDMAEKGKPNGNY